MNLWRMNFQEVRTGLVPILVVTYSSQIKTPEAKTQLAPLCKAALSPPNPEMPDGKGPG